MVAVNGVGVSVGAVAFGETDLACAAGGEGVLAGA